MPSKIGLIYAIKDRTNICHQRTLAPQMCGVVTCALGSCTGRAGPQAMGGPGQASIIFCGPGRTRAGK